MEICHALTLHPTSVQMGGRCISYYDKALTASVEVTMNALQYDAKLYSGTRYATSLPTRLLPPLRISDATQGEQ